VSRLLCAVHESIRITGDLCSRFTARPRSLFTLASVRLVCTDCYDSWFTSGLLVYEALIQSGVQVTGLEYLARLSSMPSSCACGCGLSVNKAGHYRKNSRLRELAAGRPCPRNERSAAKKLSAPL